MYCNFFKRMQLAGSSMQLAILRICIAAYVFYISSSYIFELIFALEIPLQGSRRTYLPNFFIETLPLYIFPELILSVQIIAIFVILGLFTKVAIPILTIQFILLFSYYYQTTSYPLHWIYFIFPLIVLSFADCSNRLSIDSLFQKHKKSSNPQAFRWPIELCGLWFCFIYFAAAFAKILPLDKGINWIEGGSIKWLFNQRFLDSPLHYIFNEPLFDYASAYWTFTILAALAIITELIVIITLFTDRFNFFVISVILGMHISLIFVGVSGFFLSALVLSIALIPPRLFPDYREAA